jgi:hypothetical protein
MIKFFKKTKARLHAAPAWQKKIIGLLFILYGFIAFITPVTPGSWLLFIGLELLGIRLIFLERIKSRFIK